MSCVLVVGGGGREHALAWALSRSRHVERLIAAPGNPGIAACGRAENAPVASGDTASLVELCRRQRVDLVVVGPEGPLAAGLVDELAEAGVAAFGPSASCARLEASKAYCKRFLIDNGIPTAPAHIFHDVDEALGHLRGRPDVPVVKASGLAAGKGVIVPATRQEAAEAVESMLVGGRFGAAGSEILLEDRLEGRELSVLAFCDGERFAVLPPAQDHKRLLEGDRGPNTGGMGAVAPSPVADRDLVAEVCGRIITPALDALRRAGTPYRGVLYAGLMLTGEGPKVIEFNCRFGDPEAQAVLPLLRSDLYEIMAACATGSLDGVAIDWSPEACVAVVMASAGYPDGTAEPVPILGLEDAAEAGCTVFHAGTGTIDGRLHATGGRVLAVTAVGPDVEAAARKAHRGVAAIDFEGAQHRADIGLVPSDAGYRAAGVDIDAGNRAVALMAEAVASTRTPEVINAVRGFGGLYSAAALDPDSVLVASTDGVGTKVALAARHGRWHSIGTDLVNHCIGDIAVHGARPLFFLDYIAMDRLVPAAAAEIVAGMADACRAVGCALLGGETAEMPGVYAPGAVDVAGTIVGAAPRDGLLPRPEDVRAGDLLVGVASSGPHTNGYSLIRRLLDGRTPDAAMIDALLEPHRNYLPVVDGFSEAGVQPKGLAHITGGGLFDNLPRVLPDHLGARIELGSWPVPEPFRTLVDWGGLDDAEAFRVWNMGVGLVAVVGETGAEALIHQGHPVIGSVVDAPDPARPGASRVLLEGNWR